MKKLFLLMFFSLMIVSLIGAAEAADAIITYSDSSYTTIADDFALGDTVYGQIPFGNLIASRFVWINQAGNEVKTSDCYPSGVTTFNDNYITLTNAGDSTGIWHVKRLLYGNGCGSAPTSDPQNPILTTFYVYQCVDNGDCDDGNACTTDTCGAGTCSYSNVPNGQSCGTGTCNNGQCSEPQIPEFSAISAGIALIGAGIGFLALRRKR